MKPSDTLDDPLREEMEARKTICFDIVDEVMAGQWDSDLNIDGSAGEIDFEPLKHAFRTRAGLGWASSQLMTYAVIRGYLRRREATARVRSDVEKLLARYR